MLQPRRLKMEETIYRDKPDFLPRLREIAKTQLRRRDLRTCGLLFCPMLLHNISHSGITPKDLQIGIAKQSSLQLITAESAKGAYYIYNGLANPLILEFGETDSFSWVRIFDQFEPDNPHIHWRRSKLRLFSQTLPMIIQETITSGAYIGQPITRLVNHPALANIFIKNIEIEQSSDGTVKMTIEPDPVSHLKAHQFIPVPDIPA